ncbi:unnamed protein product [Paramecium octaurelia]|uniref:Transmembrane protein n=1 Tax=Paramecium octaurelia TaxID=43137 RepID=A0A8S1TTF2_PAROT|nr:unnamed protein product [Paramecium octaurelia]
MKCLKNMQRYLCRSMEVQFQKINNILLFSKKYFIILKFLLGINKPGLQKSVRHTKFSQNLFLYYDQKFLSCGFDNTYLYSFNNNFGGIDYQDRKFRKTGLIIRGEPNQNKLNQCKTSHKGFLEKGYSDIAQISNPDNNVNVMVNTIKNLNRFQDNFLILIMRLVKVSDGMLQHINYLQNFIFYFINQYLFVKILIQIIFVKIMQKYILCDKSNQSQLSLNLSKSQQKLVCKSIHDQIKERTQSKETTHRSTQNNQLSQRVKQSGSLSSVIANFFGPSEQKKRCNEVSENIEKSKVLVIKELKNQLDQKDEQIKILTQQLQSSKFEQAYCGKCNNLKEKFQKLQSSIIQQQNLFLQEFKTNIENDENLENEDVVQKENQKNIESNTFQFKSSMNSLKSFIEKLSHQYIEVDDRSNMLINAMKLEKQELQQRVVQLEQKVRELQCNEQIMQKKLEQLQNPYQKYKNQLQQSASLTKLNPEIECQVNVDKILHVGQPYLRTRYISQKENKNSQMSLF